eukprot:comp21656_c1_seq1/m.30448 comp21656_c1_seq1/g.30448  ORF comp21656_c1_seq1/g.30448 comp21656_c1_seq1/m.30448 type:complete len:113 (-) comp21656_c1_seq1:538-876(-)
MLREVFSRAIFERSVVGTPGISCDTKVDAETLPVILSFITEPAFLVALNEVESGWEAREEKKNSVAPAEAGGLLHATPPKHNLVYSNSPRVPPRDRPCGQIVGYRLSKISYV